MASERPIRVQVRSGETGSGGAYEQVWADRPEILAVRAALNSATLGPGDGAFIYRYGRMMAPRSAGFGTVAPEDLTHKWVRVQVDHGVAPDEDWRTYWCGIVPTQIDKPDNRDFVQTPTGDIEFAALGPTYVLRQARIAASWWKIPDYPQPQALGWHPGFNKTFAGDRLVGNRGQTYFSVAHFGGAERWNHRQMLEYIVARHVQQWRDAAYTQRRWPAWSITGPGLEALATLETEVEVGENEDVESVLRKIVSPELGFDFAILPTEEGFALVVYKLTPNAEATTVDVSAWGDTEKRVEIETSRARLYDRVEVVGKRIVVCFSADGKQGTLTGRELIGRWPAALEDEYKAATGTDDAEKNDALRADDRYRDVYQSWAVARADWPLIFPAPYWPSCRADGQIEWNSPGQFWELDTLPRTPMREGYRYDTDPPTHELLGDEPPALRPPQAWVRIAPAGPWVPVDQLASVQRLPGQVSALRGAVGVRVNFAHNHALAAATWAGAKASQFDPYTEGFSRTDLVVTLAVESDHRVRVVQELPVDERANLGLTLTVEMEGAELHVLLPGTVFGVRSDGWLWQSPGTPLVLRDDRPAMQKRLDAIVARYLAERQRAIVKFNSLEEARDYPGRLLRLGVGALAAQTEITPITSVVWDWQQQTTTIGTGGVTRGAR